MEMMTVYGVPVEMELNVKPIVSVSFYDENNKVVNSGSNFDNDFIGYSDVRFFIEKVLIGDTAESIKSVKVRFFGCD